MMKSTLPVLLLFALLPAAAAVNDWPQFRHDATHQGAVPASANAEFGPFKQSWWGNVSIPLPAGSPAVYGGIVYFGDGNGRLHAFDQESGGVIWSNTTGARILSTPAVGQDYVYVVNEAGNLYAFDRKTGQQRQGYPISVGATVGSVLHNEDVLYVADNAGTIKSYLASTRELRWTYQVSYQNLTAQTPAGCTPASIEGTPVLYGTRLFVGSNNHCFYALPTNARGTNKPVWTFKADAEIRASPTIDTAGQRVIFADLVGKVYAVPIASSEIAVASWTYTVPNANVPTEIKSSPAIAEGKIVFGSRNGKVTALTTGGTMAWEKDVSAFELRSSPAIANGHVLIGSLDRKMYMLKLADGSVVDTRLALGEIDSSPAISGTQGFWSDKDGNLYSFGGDKPARPDLAVEGLHASLTAGQTGSVSATIRSKGAMAAPASKASLFAGDTLVAEANVPELAPGATYPFAASHTPGAPGVLTLRLMADSPRLIQEADESNNVGLLTTTVQSAPVQPTGGGDGTGDEEEPGIPGFETVFVLAAAALALVVWRRR